MSYLVTRQSNFYDNGAFSVEIAHGLDNVSPGALASRFTGEFEEFNSPIEAAEVAIRIRKEWAKIPMDSELLSEGTIPFVISGSSAFGLYPTVADGFTAAGLRRWSRKAFANSPKCDYCGDIVPKADNYRDDFGEYFTACDDYCAEMILQDRCNFDADSDD